MQKYFRSLRVKADRPVSSVVKRTLSVREAWGSIPGSVKSAQCRQPLATDATFLRSRVAKALSRGDGPRRSLHASVYYREYNEDLILMSKSRSLRKLSERRLQPLLV